MTDTSVAVSMDETGEEGGQAPESSTPYPMETIVRQYGKFRVTAIQPATRDGKNALVKQAIPQIAEILRRYDRRMAEQEQRDALKRQAEKERVA